MGRTGPDGHDVDVAAEQDGTGDCVATFVPGEADAGARVREVMPTVITSRCRGRPGKRPAG
jgi:hypothetical protein